MKPRQQQKQQHFLFSYFLLLQELFTTLPCWEYGDAGEREGKRHDDNNNNSNKTNNNIFSTRSEPPDRCLGFSNRPHFYSPKPRN